MAKKTLPCHRCETQVSKTDAQFVDAETFAFLSKPPPGVDIGIYCHTCFDSHVQQELDRYNEKVERAKNVNIFYASQSKESRFVRRIERPIAVKDCTDRDEAILRLAFLAIEADKNALVDVALSTTKVRLGSWQSSLWSGQGIPCNIAEAELQRKFMGTPN
jgi:hypothetical protein